MPTLLPAEDLAAHGIPIVDRVPMVLHTDVWEVLDRAAGVAHQFQPLEGSPSRGGGLVVRTPSIRGAENAACFSYSLPLPRSPLFNFVGDLRIVADRLTAWTS
jgi:hypothetical protein